MLGRRMAIGSVALEITQRCNLDCSYCYLSESSEALKDIPIEEVYRRIDLIYAHYGPNTDVQVTGGDPTLRRRDELIAIVRYIRARGMRPALFTNGIKATRALLGDLVAAGLEDVAFHVDMTQGRAGFANEAALNTLRQEYIERARGLPLAVYFNTTIFGGNFAEVPMLAKFFVEQSDVVRFASFQVGADSARGVERVRVAVDPTTVIAAINAGAGTTLAFDRAGVGPSDCNRYACALVVNDHAYDALADGSFVRQVLHASASRPFARARLGRMVRDIGGFLFGHPMLAVGIGRRVLQWAWRARRDLVRARGQVRKLSFFVHNFMDAQSLDRDRCDACSFMVMTPEGPLSMCVHNAKRDDYLLVPARLERASTSTIKFFNPATGVLEDQIPLRIEVRLNRKNARGRAKIGVDAAHHTARDRALT